MDASSLKFFDIFLTFFHDAFSIWNCLAWIFPKLRFLHFITINLTFLSWIGLGYFYGWGYCFLTDYHYNIKYQLGERNLPPSYIQLRIYEIFGILPDLELTNWILGILFSLLLIISYYFQLSSKNYFFKQEDLSKSKKT